MNSNRVVGTAQPIEIDERFEDLRYFQLAVVLDRQDCMDEITELKKKFLDYTSSPKRLKESVDKLPEFRNDITFLALKYFRPSSFESVMLAAVLYGKITLKNYKPVKFKIFDHDNWFKYSPGITMTIILDQFTTKKELIDLFDKKFEIYKEKLFKKVPGKLFGPIYKELKNSANITNIKRDRKWYWRNKDGESYAQIALSELNEEDRTKQLRHDNSLTDVPGVESVKKAIQRYKKLITVDIYDHLT